MKFLAMFFSQLLMLPLIAFIGIVEKINKKFSLVGDKEFFEKNQFEWIAQIEKNWEKVRDEIQPIAQSRLHELPRFHDIATSITVTKDSRWKTFFLYGYGIKCEKNCQTCPETTALLGDIKGMKTAFFSILSPGMKIPQHRGPFNGVLRYHLALVVPKQKERCVIKVGNSVRHWDEGSSLIFDDSYLHQVQNNTDEMRIILFVDFERPLPAWATVINRFLIKLIQQSWIVQQAIANNTDWENKFHHNL
jgi:ornithine lipid ester-linked acyl 2-hydroxylase